MKKMIFALLVMLLSLSSFAYNEKEKTMDCEIFSISNSIKTKVIIATLFCKDEIKKAGLPNFDQAIKVVMNTDDSSLLYTANMLYSAHSGNKKIQILFNADNLFIFDQKIGIFGIDAEKIMLISMY